MKFHFTIISLWLACLAVSNGEIIISNFLAPGGYKEGLAIVTHPPKEATSTTFDFYLTVGDTKVFIYKKEHNEEKRTFTASHPYQVTTIDESGKLVEIQIKKEEAKDFIYRIGLTGHRFTIIETPADHPKLEFKSDSSFIDITEVPSQLESIDNQSH
ncbi:hypothetical protein QEH52_19420 [Coraliomargarita sp. SDUM461003]|uniref:DUF2846 domain-containing protein n=1 Tax=Thalassobacterium maritimum TaxID=3041265 RepID=A0ABU1AZZ2_9BACT|nr:hypothetical protein [Coraliomargarita sp. SDUM461003]MDQ8209697.1 hypothetical protein [Coraliomargarita sp. SDUM461003]|tara:strand:- start:80 stop:550 length:471 start_codon:yes stop_codon:yes gene_type:complete